MKQEKKDEVIVLAMHGAPPLDFPPDELARYFEFLWRREHGQGNMTVEEEANFNRLEERIRRWPRHEANDPFYAGSLRLKQALERVAGVEVILGFNEFCAPSVEEALEEACSRSPKTVRVITPMLTPGGEHAAREIPAAVFKVGEKFPEINIVYCWPFEVEEVAEFLYRASQKDCFNRPQK